MTEWKYSQLTFTEKKNHIYKLSFYSQKEHFLAIWRPKLQKIFPLLSTLGIPHGDKELSKL